MQQALYYSSAGNWGLYHLVSWQECQFKIFPLLPFQFYEYPGTIIFVGGMGGFPRVAIEERPFQLA